jgi:hypothetical protein
MSVGKHIGTDGFPIWKWHKLVSDRVAFTAKGTLYTKNVVDPSKTYNPKPSFLRKFIVCFEHHVRLG